MVFWAKRTLKIFFTYFLTSQILFEKKFQFTRNLSKMDHVIPFQKFKGTHPITFDEHKLTDLKHIP